MNFTKRIILQEDRFCKKTNFAKRQILQRDKFHKKTNFTKKDKFRKEYKVRHKSINGKFNYYSKFV